MHIVRVAISRRVEAAWPRSHICRSAASRICSRRPTRSVGPGTICSSSAGCFEEAIPSHAFAGRPTRPQGSVHVDLDGTVAADDAGQFAQRSERRLPRRAASTGVPHHGLARGSAGPALAGSQKEAAAGPIQERPESCEEADQPGLPADRHSREVGDRALAGVDPSGGNF